MTTQKSKNTLDLHKNMEYIYIYISWFFLKPRNLAFKNWEKNMLTFLKNQEFGPPKQISSIFP